LTLILFRRICTSKGLVNSSIFQPIIITSHQSRQSPKSAENNQRGISIINSSKDFQSKSQHFDVLINSLSEYYTSPCTRSLQIKSFKTPNRVYRYLGNHPSLSHTNSRSIIQYFHSLLFPFFRRYRGTSCCFVNEVRYTQSRRRRQTNQPTIQLSFPRCTPSRYPFAAHLTRPFIRRKK